MRTAHESSSRKADLQCCVVSDDHRLIPKSDEPRIVVVDSDGLLISKQRCSYPTVKNVVRTTPFVRSGHAVSFWGTLLFPVSLASFLHRRTYIDCLHPRERERERERELLLLPLLGVSSLLVSSIMAGNDWINSYLEAILDAGPSIDAAKSSLLLRERGRFSPARYFVEEVITGYDETDLYKTWVRVLVTAHTSFIVSVLCCREDEMLSFLGFS